MNLKMRLYNNLICIADNPENEFDKIISKNKKCLNIMTEEQLSEIHTLRQLTAKLCRDIPYSREDIASLIENNEVSPYNKVAELENNFMIAEYIFARLNGEKY